MTESKHNQYLFINYIFLFWLMSYSSTDYVSLIGSIGSIVLCLGTGYSVFLRKYFHMKNNIKIKSVSHYNPTMSNIYVINNTKRHLYSFKIDTKQLFSNMIGQAVYNSNISAEDISKDIEIRKKFNFGQWKIIKASEQENCTIGKLTIEECNISKFKVSYKIKIIRNWYISRSHYINVEKY